MLVAVQMGNIVLLKYHVSEGIDVNYEHPELMTTALIESIQFDQIEIACFYLSTAPTQVKTLGLAKIIL